MTDAPHARSADPHTSHDAAASVRNIRDSQERILQLFFSLGPMHDQALIECMTFSSVVPRMSESGIRSRRAELVAMGLVRDSGTTVMLPTGRQSIVWEAV